MTDNNNEITGKVYDIQGFSVHDGPGIRTTVFLKGCPLRCRWCHSPESQQFLDQLVWMAIKCRGVKECGKCLTVCPNDAIAPGKITTQPSTNAEIQQIYIERYKCDNCGRCAKACHSKALDICGKDWTVEELTQRLLRDKPYYEHSGGGVTISGGEALSQFEFTLALLKRLKNESTHTALDTTGFAPAGHILATIPYTDLFLYDLKHMDSDMHEKMTGAPNGLILSNARAIAENGALIQIRMPIIPMFSDSEENARSTAEFCRELGASVSVVQLLPYHNLGVMKYQRLDHNAALVEAAPPTEEKIERIKSIFEGYGLPVIIH